MQRRPSRAARPAASATSNATVHAHRKPHPAPVVAAVRLALLGSLLAVWQAAAFAQPASPAAPAARPAQESHTYDIPPGPLGNVLARYARESNALLAATPDQVQGKTSPGVRGTFSNQAALDALLVGTGLEAATNTRGQFVLRQAAGVTALPTVTVTAEQPSALQTTQLPSYKFTAPLLDTPRSITVIPEEVIKEKNISTLADALRTVPGITFLGAEAAANPASDRPVIRGFEARNSIFVDGMRDAGVQNRETFDVENVSILKGADSVYAGRGSVGGSIDITTKMPKSEDFFNASTGLGTNSYRRGTVDWNRQLGETSAFRLNVMGYDADKPGRSDVYSRRWGVAPSIAFGLNTPTTVSISYYHMYSSSMPDFSAPFPTTGGMPVETKRSQFLGLNDRDYNHSTTDSVEIKIDHRIDDTWKLRNTTMAGRTTLDFLGTLPVTRAADPGMIVLQGKNGKYATNSAANQTELTGSFDSLGVRHTLTAGVEFSRSKAVMQGYLINDSSGRNIRLGGSCTVLYNCTPIGGYWNPDNPWTGTIALDQDSYPGPATYSYTNIASTYLFDTVKLSDRWTLSGGARYDYFDVKAEQQGFADLKSRSNLFTYQVGLAYKPIETLSLYTSYSTSANPPGAANSSAVGGNDQITGANKSLSPERARNIEVGAKWDVFDRRLSLTAALFQSQRTNAFVSDGLGGTVNAGSQRVRGTEFGFAGNVTDKWGVFGGYSYMNAVTTDAGPANPAASGLPMTMVPKHSFTLWTTYDLLPQLTLGAGVTASSMIYSSVSATKRTWVPGYARVDTSATYRVSKSVDLRLNVNNIFDRKYYQSSLAYAEWAPARSAVLTMNIHM